MAVGAGYGCVDWILVLTPSTLENKAVKNFLFSSQWDYLLNAIKQKQIDPRGC